ncbi:MAG: M43 family zinc metalloprotease [Bacteroidota bacterium]
MRISLVFYGIILNILIFCTACSPRLERHFIQGAEVEVRNQTEENPRVVRINGREVRMSGMYRGGRCNEVDAYIPDLSRLNQFPDYQMRVNFHFIDTEDRLYNYSEEEAHDMISSMMYSANVDLRDNNRVWLPYGNDLPQLPIGYQMVLAKDPSQGKGLAVYFHQDNELAYYVHRGRDRNIQKREVIKKYGIGMDSILNIFIMPHHPDSVISPTYHVGGVGVYLGNAIKMAGMYELKQEGWAYRGILNHEVGHGLGLQHAWGNDGCQDTPKHNNECWNRSTKPHCDTAATNNVMDYNAYQNAWSPCQVGRVRRTLANERSSMRKYLVPFWNQLDTNQNITIQDSIHWAGARDIKGHLIITTGATLKLSCRLGMPKGAKIIIEPGAQLILENARLHHPGNFKWQGIEVQQLGKEKGKLVISGDTQIVDLEHPIDWVLPEEPKS